MAKPPGRKLKVYSAHLGFDDSVVAAANQGEALKAWGVRQNLFAEGQAAVETDPAAVAAALERPGTPLRRPAGGDGVFGLDAQPPRSIPQAKRPAGRRAASKVQPPAKPEPDRAEFDAAEQQLKRLERAHADELEALERRRIRLDEDEADAKRAWARTHEAAARRLEQARNAFRRAGGAS